MSEGKIPPEQIFYEIANGMIPGRFYEDEYFAAFLDKAPAIELEKDSTHALLVPKRQGVRLIQHFNDKESAQWGNAICNVVEILTQNYNKVDLSISMSNGKYAHQEVQHAHMHFIVRGKGDRLNDPNNPDKSLVPYDVSSGFKRTNPTSSELSDLCNKLKDVRIEKRQ